MSSLKKISLILFVGFLALAYTADASAAIETQKTQKHRKKHHDPVGAPIDGGLLSVLGVAGVSYYLLRKKKKEVSSI